PRSEFIRLAASSVGRGSEEEYGLLFDSVVVSQGQRGLFFHGDLKHSRVKRVPCWKPPRSLTCPHRDPVQKVNGSLPGDLQGSLVLSEPACSFAGTMLCNLWVTDVVLLQNVHKIAVSFTSKEVCFYDTLSKKDFRCKYKVQGLKFTPWCLDYWSDASKPDQAILALGDIGGQVSALYFTSAQMYLFERRSRWTDSDSALIIQWDDVVKGKHHCCSIVQHQAHKPAWVRKVLYLDSLEAFVSCSTRPQSSIAIGWEEKGGKSLQVTTFFTERGVWDLDYHRELKLIATAGADHRVLLWNPYVTSQPSYLLSGHVAPVAAVCFLQKKKHLLSYSRDKVLCLWDVSSQLCIHRLGGVFPATREDARTLLLLIEERQLLLLTFNSLLVLLESTKEETRASGHKHPVTCVLYNSLFRHVRAWCAVKKEECVD
uniref:Uncharacterized protein n=1 Tax=Hippocampus comes TaxID=109280 RepID=A0A3Q3DE08_HIPCM